MLKKISMAILMMALLIATGCSSDNLNPDQRAAVDEFAQCLTEAKAMMYGAYWCPHCQDQKEMFGDSFDYVDYVECDPNGEDSRAVDCLNAGIEGYPTWIIGGDVRLEGVQTFEDLADATGCPAPETTS